eukprot:Em0017g491a
MQQQQRCPHRHQQQSCPHRQQQQQQKEHATCTSPTTGTSIGTSAPITTLPAATLAAATTTRMASYGWNQAAEVRDEAGGEEEARQGKNRTVH